MLVYGKEAWLPFSLVFSSLELAHQLELIKDDATSIRMVDLMEIEEKRGQDIQTLELYQQ